ncbi:MAG: NAD(P)/FAD-dependent oxidoreductase [Actinomycetota bacterium]
MHIVVVGAGLAGMRAAERLRAAGCDATLIEGGHRPGGRVRTVRDPFAGGQYSESGAEWVDDIHHRMLELLDRHGVEVAATGERWTVIRRWLYWNGELLGPDRIRDVEPGLAEQLDHFDMVVDAAAAGIDDPGRPHLHLAATAIDGRSLADVAEQTDLGMLARLMKRRDAQGEFAAEPAQVSLLFVAQQRAYHRHHAAGREVLAHRALGGFSQATDGMARDLGDISFGEMLLEVEQDADGVQVRTSRRSIRADHVVLACSLVPLRSVHFATPMPDALAEAVHGLGYGTVTKTSVQWSTRAWPSGYATTSGVAQRVYEPTVDQPGEPGILMSYCGGQGGHEWASLSESDRVALAATEMRSMHSLQGEVLGGYSRAWSTEVRYGGSYAVYEPGQVTRYWDILRRPWGRVHLAGEHVADCTGYMEGALESGESVARRILESD